MDLRHLAVILNSGKEAAEELGDAPLAAALDAMTETAVGLHTDHQGVWDLEENFGKLLRRYE